MVGLFASVYLSASSRVNSFDRLNASSLIFLSSSTVDSKLSAISAEVTPSIETDSKPWDRTIEGVANVEAVNARARNVFFICDFNLNGF